MRNAEKEQDILTGVQTKLALRVLSGPNRGAETWLDAGSRLRQECPPCAADRGPQSIP